ncbi:MAG: sugar ABC transporter ATP-binding protein [Christensenellales bacterium]
MDIIRLENIYKNFEGVQALKNVSFDLRQGEVHVLLGENGAGKSTLIKIIAGIYRQTAGDVYLKGEKVIFHSPKDAEQKGICVIHQEQNLLLDRDVAANIFLGREIKKNGILDYQKMHIDAATHLERLGIALDTHTQIRNLGIAQRQMIEITKAMAKNPKVLIMDEPTASLTTSEISILFNAIYKLQKEGISIIYISHRMEEIVQIATRVTILRDGQIVDSAPIEKMTMDRIVVGIVGRNINSTKFRKKCETGNKVLQVNNLSGDRFSNCSLEVKYGEVVGIAGLIGSGRTELVETVFGIRSMISGEVLINGKRINPDPETSTKIGVGFLPEDRKKDGLILDKSIRENVILPSRKKLHKLGVLNKNKEKDFTNKYIKSLRIATPNCEKQTVELSGGTQQKVIIARWLCSNSNLLIFDEPTRGIDIGSREEIYNLINDLTLHGVAILLVSSDILELLGITDKIYTMYKGKITGELITDELTSDILFSKIVSKGDEKVG